MGRQTIKEIQQFADVSREGQSMQAICWVLAVALLMGLQALLGGGLRQLMVGPPFLGVVGFTILFGAKKHGWKVLFKGLTASFTGKSSPELEGFNGDVGSLAMLSANICAVLGLVHVMTLLNDPSRIGEGVAMAFLSYVYGALLAGLLPSNSPGKKASKLSVTDGLIPAAVLATFVITILFAISKR